jgi:hypothetical protein
MLARVEEARQKTSPRTHGLEERRSFHEVRARAYDDNYP